MAGSITVSSITLDSDNNFSIRSNTGATILSANGTGLITGIASGSAITNAQLTTPTVSGNLSLDSTGTSGVRLPAANTLTFHTSGTEDMRITSAGDVGIGVTSPQMKVDVSGGVRVQSISNPTSGSGMELAYDGTQGIIQAYSNRAALTSVPVYLVTGQLKFPASQNASSDANTLDDYEEGNWTPTVTAAGSNPTVVYSANVGTYTKIGRMVMIQCYVETTSRTGGSGEVRIAGLPFTPANQSQSYAGAGASQAGGLTGATTVGVRPNANVTYMTLYKNGGSVALDVSEWGNSALFLVALSYIV